MHCENTFLLSSLSLPFSTLRLLSHVCASKGREKTAPPSDTNAEPDEKARWTRGRRQQHTPNETRRRKRKRNVAELQSFVVVSHSRCEVDRLGKQIRMESRNLLLSPSQLYLPFDQRYWTNENEFRSLFRCSCARFASQGRSWNRFLCAQRGQDKVFIGCFWRRI